MKFFIDTANLEQIREANALGVLDGVTTNPSLMAKEGIKGVENQHKHYIEICNIVDGDVSAEVIATNYDFYPLMTVAGDHAKNDLAGDEEDSWRRRLEAEGYETVCVLTGLGEHPAVRALFVEHARQAEQLQAEAC